LLLLLLAYYYRQYRNIDYNERVSTTPVVAMGCIWWSRQTSTMWCCI